MLSVLAGSLLMAACAYTGIGIKRIYRKRHEVFTVFEKLVIILKGEITYRKTPIVEIFELFIYEKKGLPYEILKKYLACLKTNIKSANELYENTKSIFLNGDDNKLIANFLFSLGKNDLYSEIENLKRYEINFNLLKKSTEMDCIKKGSMYFKLCILLGVALMIIVV